MSELVLRNRQRARRVHTPLLRRIVRSLLTEFAGIESYELGIHLVAVPEITGLNETYLHHVGSTDVVTFDYSVGQASRLSLTPLKREDGDRRDARPTVHGDILLCVDEAIAAARRFRTSWQSELVRYLVHGVLHLLGHDDRTATARRKMKRVEDRLLLALAGQFHFQDLASRPHRQRTRKS